MTITDSEPAPDGLCRTIAWHTDQPTYALEGNIRSAGSTLAWLAGVIDTTPGDLADLAETVPNTAGVTIVPAFGGLAAPWWDPHATGIITGVTLGTSRAHLARAALESIAHQVEDVVTAANPTPDRAPGTIRADGGIAANLFVMQLQADISGRTVHASQQAELSALGAADLGQVAAGTHTLAALASQPRPHVTLKPQLDGDKRHRQRQQWNAALAQSRCPHGGDDTPHDLKINR
jgi:glycerol kinase